jgi:hypothetical protein
LFDSVSVAEFLTGAAGVAAGIIAAIVRDTAARLKFAGLGLLAFAAALSDIVN